MENPIQFYKAKYIILVTHMILELPPMAAA